MGTWIASLVGGLLIVPLLALGIAALVRPFWVHQKIIRYVVSLGSINRFARLLLTTEELEIRRSKIELELAQPRSLSPAIKKKVRLWGVAWLGWGIVLSIVLTFMLVFASVN